MPPIMFSALSYPMTRLAHVLFPTAMANGVIAGSFVFCESSPHAYSSISHMSC